MEKSQIVDLSEKNFEERVIKSSKPVLVDFYAPWCGSCAIMAPILEQLAEKHQAKIEVVKVNINGNQAIASKYKIMSLPSILIFNQGKIVSQLLGGKNLKELEKALSKFL